MVSINHKFLIAVVFLVAIQSAQAGYGNYRAVTLFHSKVPNTDQTNFRYWFTTDCDTLGAAQSSTSSTSWTMSAGNCLQNGDYFEVDTEIVLVTAGGGTTAITGTRAQKGTSAATHSNGATVTNMFLADSSHGGTVTSSSCYDVVFAADTSNLKRLNHQIVLCTNSTGKFYAWVRCPSVSHTADTTIYIFYGNSAVTTSQEAVISMWAGSQGQASAGFSYIAQMDGDSSDTFGVDVGSDTAITYNTSNGKLYKGAGFNGTTSQIGVVGASCLLSPAGVGHGLNPTIVSCAQSSGITVSAWVNATSFPNAYNTVDGNDNNAVGGHFLSVKSTGKLAVYLSRPGASINYDGTGTNTLSTGTWYYLAFTYDKVTLIGYVNGASDKSVADASGYNNGDNQIIGADTTASRVWNGAIDQFTIRNIAVSGDTLTAEYNNEGSPPTFSSIGVATIPSSGGASTAAYVE